MARTKGHNPPPGAGRVSHLRKPKEMPLEAWQIALRRQVAAEQDLKLTNLGGRPVFSEFNVTNPKTGRTYRLAIRGEGLGENFCSCPDYAVNTLGTCKHIEFALGALRRRPGGKAALAGGFRPPYSEVFLRYGAKREVIFRAGTDCPRGLRALAGEYFGRDGILEEQAYARFHTFLTRTSSLATHDLRCYDDALNFVSQAHDRAECAKRIDRAFPGGPDDKAFRKLLKAPLYRYQCEGALLAAKAGRCLLADDMGLGKTIQAIAAAEILAAHAGVRRVLVVCPTSLKHQWEREIAKFTSRSARVVEGLSAARDRLYAEESFYKIITYNIVHRDEEAIRRWQPDLIVLDEAQRIKNWKTRAAKSVKQLASEYALVLTGTPLENRLEELHSIVEFVDRFRLGPMFGFLARHQHLDDTGRVIGYRDLSGITRTLAPILIRRTKETVLKELPERIDKRFFVPMTDEQMRHHEENRETVARIVQKWRRFGYLSEMDQRRMMIALQNMRMACDSTYLLDGETDHGFKADELASLLGEILEDREAKVVVFSQWLRMHELIVDRVGKRKWGHVLFHGGVPGPKRKDLIERFREDPACRLFLSTDAGGVGLNLQMASVVANMDLPWNPAVLEQRIGRVHRLGQHRPVRVVHFIAKGTIEESMLNVLAFKKSMFAGVLDGGKDEVFLGGTRLKQFMDSVEQASTSIPAPMPAPAAEDAEPQAPAGKPAGAGQAAAAALGAGTGGAAAQRPAAGGGIALPNPAALGELLSAGAAFLGQLGQSLRAQAAQGSLVARDESTGQSYLKLPLPQGDALQGLLGLLTSFVSGQQGK